jgi:hypothetical protein
VPEEAACHREQQAFGDERARDLPPVGAEGGPHGAAALALDDAGELEVSDVRAGDDRGRSRDEEPQP